MLYTHGLIQLNLAARALLQRGHRVLPALGLTLLLASACARPPIRGQLVDYLTNEPVENATVTLTQRGWGRSNGGVVWDKAYTSTTLTDPDGRFQLALPAPRLLAGSSGSISVQAPGWQRLVDVPVSGEGEIVLQTLPVLDAAVPGGIARVGVLEDGTHFGWSFVNNAPAVDPDRADIFPIVLEREPLVLSITVPAGGGLTFVPAAEQGIASPSYGHLLRYLSEAPAGEYGDTLELHATAGTVVVRTPYDRYAKLAFDPQRMTRSSGMDPGLSRPVRFSVMLPFAYNPRPGREFPYDPTGRPVPVNPELAGALARLPAVDGEHFTHNGASLLVGSIRPTLMPVDVYVPAEQPRRYLLHLQEVREGAP